MTDPAAGQPRSETRFAAALDCAQLGVWDADLVENTCFYSASWKRMLGYAEHELTDDPDLWLHFIHPDDRQRALESGSGHVDGTTEAIETEFRLQHRDGRWLWVLDRGRVVERDADGRPTRMIGVQTDITTQKEAEVRLVEANHLLEELLERERARQEELSYLARHDGLTDLLNRTAFEKTLTDALATEKRTGEHALFFVDLDGFKMVNDTAGHVAGDALLKLVARTMIQTLPEAAVIARLGGDEFTAIVSVADADAAYGLGCDLVRAITDQQRSLKIDRRVGASVGIVLFKDAGCDAHIALSVADAACYVSKSRGRNRVSLHDPDKSRENTRFAEVRAASGLLDAIEHDRLVLYGQKIVNLSAPAPSIERLEVLARLVSPDGSVIGPGAFIPAAERFDLMGVLDRHVVRSTLETIAASGIAEAAKISVAVNLSAMSLSNADFWPFVEEQFRRTQVPPDRICFEITETAAVANFAEAERFVRSAKAAGCRISLDDFGSGLSSFAYLRRFPVDCIKIDGAFVDDVAGNSFDQAVCAAIGAIADQLGVEVIAERVADSDAIQVLKACRIGFGQGFYLHRPEPLRNLLAAGTASIPIRA